LNQDRPTPDQEFNLAGILNILWRRRLIVLGLPVRGLVVGALYGIFGTRRWEATATIRPGITAFSPEGGPVREWQLKDITRWYDRMLYRRELVRRLDLPAKARPVIRAEFIAQGLQNLQGGDLVTLWTTATSPELAAAIIDTSLALFAEYAVADTVSSNIKLTRDGLRLQVRNLEYQLEALEREAASLDLQLQSARAESLLVEAEDRQLALDLDKLERKQAWCDRRLRNLQDEAPRLAHDLEQLDLVLRRLAADSAQTVDPAEIPAWARRDAVLDGGDVLEALSRAKLDVQRALTRNLAAQDSVTYAAAICRLDRQQLDIARETSILAKIREARGKIGELILQRYYDLPAKRQELRYSIAERTVKLATISPVQHVGPTVTSDDPVRPRPLRAILILVFLGAIGGMVLGFAWDYVWAHRRDIFRS